MVILEGPDVELRLDVVNDLMWCRVELAFEGRRYNLGADSFEIVCSRLAKALDTALWAGQQGGEPSWVTSFSEEHCTILISNGSTRRELIFKDAAGKELHRAGLSVDEAEHWREQLLNQGEKAKN